MASTALSIINAGLRIIGQSSVSSITPPKSTIEKIVAADGAYDVWRDSELTKRRWLFATDRVLLSPEGDAVPNTEKPYKFRLPGDQLRPIREKTSDWEQRGQYLWSSYSQLVVDIIVRKVEGEFTALFADVLAARVALEMCEPVSQSDTKYQKALDAYSRAIRDAGRVNAFIIGPEDVTTDDMNDTWVRARMYPGEGV